VNSRLVAVVAFGIGYVLGSKAGHERYRQISRSATTIGRSAPVQDTVALAGHKAGDTVTYSTPQGEAQVELISLKLPK